MKVDINLLPEEQRPKRWALPLTVALIVFMLAVGYYGYGFYGRSAAAQSQLGQLETQLASINAEIEKVINDQTIKEYQASIIETQAEIDSIEVMEQDYETRNAERVYWKPVIQTIRELAPTDINLTSFEQNDNEITVEGELKDDVDNAIIIVEYAQLLDKRGIFARSPAFEIGTEERSTGEGDETEEIFIFTMLLEVRPGG